MGRIVASALLLLAAGTLPALAIQPPPPASSAPERSALDPADASLVGRAVELLAGGDAAGAVTLLEPVRQRADAPGQLLALLGTAYLEAGRPADALEVLGPLAEAEDADPAVLYNAGRAALATGDVAGGTRFLARSVTLQGGTPAARELGLVRATQGQTRDAYRLLRPWALANPDDEEARLAAALAAIHLNRVPQAEELLEGLPPETPGTRLLWGQIRLLRDDPEGAVAILAPVLEGEGGEGALAARRTLAEAHLAMDRPQEAVELLEGRAAGDPAASLVLARAQGEVGDEEAAIATLQPLAERLLEASRSGDEIFNRELGARFGLEYGRLLAAAGRHEEAIPPLEMATGLDPNRREAWRLLAESLAAAGRSGEAASARERFDALESAEEGGAATEDPTLRAILRARDLLAAERFDPAISVLRSEIELAPDDPRPRLLESRALLLAGRSEEALERAEEIVVRFPEHPDAYYQRGTVHLALEHRSSAEADFREALALAPDHVPAMSDLAVLLTIKGERAEAERLLERVLELRPDDEVARGHLERLRDRQDG